MRLLLSAGLAATVLGIGACGAANTASTVPSGPVAGSSGGAATTSAPVVSTTATVTVTVPTATATATSAATATTPAVTTESITVPDSGGGSLTGTMTGEATVSSQCVAADFHAAAVPPNSAPGITVLGFILTNISGAACRTGGWPGVAFVDTSGAVLDTMTQRSTADELGATPEQAITLAPGADASFRLSVHTAGDSADCAVSAVQIIAPNDTATLRVGVPDGPLQICGTAAVSPLEPGSSATGQ